MSTTKKRKSKNEEVDVTASLISAVSQGNLENVKTIVHSHGLTYCECGNGGYVPLFVAIKLGHFEIAKFLLEQGAKANSCTDHIDTPLHLASFRGYVKIVQLLLQKNVPVDARNEKNETPLHLAARGNFAEIVKILLSKNASVTIQTIEGSTPLLLAAERRHEKIFQMLLEHARANTRTSTRTRNSTLLNHILLCNPSNFDKVNRLVFEIVTKDVGHSKIIDELIDHGFVLRSKYVKGVLVDAVKKNYIKLIDSSLKSGTYPSEPKYKVLLHHAVVHGRKEIVELFLKAGFSADTKNGKGRTGLCYSLKCCDEAKSIEIIQLLLSNGANINEAPTVLHEAIAAGLINVCKVLIENHADIDAFNTSGKTPLYVAVSKYGKSANSNQIDKKTRCNIIKLLLNSGAELNIHLDQHTAFHCAILSNRKEIVSLFLQSGVDVDFCTKSGETPLFLASSKGYSEIAEVLCKSNADVNLKNGGGASPLYCAVRRRKTKVTETLLKFGADIDFELNDVRVRSYDSDDWDEDDSDDYDESEYDSDYDERHNNAFAILKKHVIKLIAAHLNVDQLNPFFYYTYYSAFKQECEEEVRQMKNKKISPPFTLYDILVNGKEPSFAKNKSLMQDLKSFNFDSFPIYKNLIEGNLEISQSRLELLQSGQQTLDVLIKTSTKLNEKKCIILPVEILEEILSYLSYRDMKSLVYCGKALKRQLGKQ